MGITPSETLTDLERARWDELCRLVAFEPQDGPALTTYVQVLSEIDELRRSVREYGMMVTGSTGQPTVNPAQRMIAQLLTQVVALQDRLCLNPKARARLGIGPATGPDDLEAFLADVAAQD